MFDFGKFPALLTQWHMHAQGGDAKQRPIDMVSEYKCTAINVDMQATVGQRSTVDGLVAASSVNEGMFQKFDSKHSS